MNDKIKEYEILRNEINENSKLIATVFIANTTVTATIVGVGLGLESPKGPIFLAPLLILIPSLFFIASQLESTTRISQYIRIILEPEVGIKWQTNWFNLRERKLLTKTIKYVPAVSGLYGSLSFVCLFLTCVHWNASLYLLIPIISAFAVPLIFAVIAVKNAFSMKYRKECADAWERLKDAEHSQ